MMLGTSHSFQVFKFSSLARPWSPSILKFKTTSLPSFYLFPFLAVLHAEGSAGAMALRGEFDRLSDAMVAWDAKLNQGLDGRLASDRASVAQTLDRYLGSKGEIAATLEGLRRELADPQSEASIPGSVAKELERKCASLEARVATSLDCTRPESELSVFLRQLRFVLAPRSSFFA